MVFHKAPWVFSGIWRILRPLLDPVVANKVIFTRTDADLLELIDEDRLPKGQSIIPSSNIHYSIDLCSNRVEWQRRLDV
jgi:hypothetical protein